MNHNKELNINDLNSANQHNIESKESFLSENLGRITTDKLQYEYLKELNKKFASFKINNKSYKKKEETEQTMRR